MNTLIIDSSRTPTFFIKDTIPCVNLNALFKRTTDTTAIKNIADNLENISMLNLCNLASLCYKIKLDYNSKECKEMLEQVINEIKSYNGNIQFIQNCVHSNLEVDIRPFSKLTQYDEENDIIYINKILKDIFRFLGYTDTQIGNLVIQTKNLLEYIPSDLMEYVTLETTKSLQSYQELMDVMND